MNNTLYDVVLIGYGPVSQVLAQMLGNQGRKVAVVERWKKRYPMPRAVCIDHELYRVLAANGLGSVLPQITHPGPKYQWFNADWKELVVIDWSAESISGGAEVHFVHQPTLEQALDKAVSVQPTVDVQLGWEAVAIEQSADYATAQLSDVDSGAERFISARYIIGCDGANSIVRKTIGGKREDRGFEADWLVIDVLLKDGVTIEQLGIPPAGQYCNPEQPTTIVPAGIREGRIYRRWEFMRLPGVTVEEMENEQRVWELLKPWAGPDDVELVRHKVYNFRSLLAERWRDRRLLLAGDSAHVMPPFMGQGMCSGMRDAWNLAWKLNLILDHKADDSLLNNYQTERLPHVRQLTDLSVYMGKIICIPDAALAAKRDTDFMDGSQPPSPEFPHLTQGLLHKSGTSNYDTGSGLLAPHTTIEKAGKTGRMDDLAGLGFMIVATGKDPRTVLNENQLAALQQLGTQYLSVNAPQADCNVTDLDNKLQPFMQQHQWRAFIVRPDFYIYGGCSEVSGLTELIEDLLADLQREGVNCATNNFEELI